MWPQGPKREGKKLLRVHGYQSCTQTEFSVSFILSLPQQYLMNEESGKVSEAAGRPERMKEKERWAVGGPGGCFHLTAKVLLPSDPSFSVQRDLIFLKCSARFVELDLTLHQAF